MPLKNDDLSKMTFKDKVHEIITNTLPDTDLKIIYGTENISITHTENSLKSKTTRHTVIIEWEDTNEHPCSGCEWYEAGCPELRNKKRQKENGE